MILGAFLNAGFPLERLRRELSKLPLNGYLLVCEKGERHKIRGTDFQVKIEKPLTEISENILNRVVEKSGLSKPVKNLSLKILSAVLETQRKVFKLKKNEVCFDGAEALDLLIDCVGAATGFDYFQFEKIYASPLPFPRGFTEDVVVALQEIPLETSKVAARLVTITGVSILKSAGAHFGESPLHKIEKTGIGLGDMRLSTQANVLKLHIGEGFPAVQLEANIDDMNPQWFDFVMDQLFAAGVVDVSLQPVQMKKNRPGVLLKILCPWDLKDKAIEIILKETTTLGVRYFPVERKILLREMKTVATRFGKLQVKFAKDPDAKIEKWIPEYEICRDIAALKKIPLRKVYEEILRAFPSKN